jgi:hypothetical protein
MAKVRRNDPCPCLSGKKFKACRLPEIKAGPPREAGNVRLPIKPLLGTELAGHRKAAMLRARRSADVKRQAFREHE